MLGNLRFTQPHRCFRVALAAISHINPTGFRQPSPVLTQLHIVAVAKIDFVY